MATDSVLPSHADVAAETDRLKLGIDASELHGAFCGWLCGGGDAGDDWLERLTLEPASAPSVDGALDALRTVSAEQLGDPDFAFELLLPADETPLGERADALLAWCRGFLGGFGLAAGATPALSPEGEEALADLGKIAASQLSYDDPDNDEAALEEVAEFVRVAALLLHGDCVLGPRARRRLN